MDIVVKTVLDLVQSVDGYKNSVLAGGSVRDYLLNPRVKARDYDIFVPKVQDNALLKALEDANIVNARKKGNEYPESYISVKEFTHEGKTFDLIQRGDIEDNEDFGNNLIDTFNFGINMCFYDGISIHTNEKFDHDQQRFTCTLYNVDNLEDGLVKAIQKYESISKVHGLRFKNKCIKFIEEPKKEKSVYENVYLGDIVRNAAPIPDANVIRNQAQWVEAAQRVQRANPINQVWIDEVQRVNRDRLDQLLGINQVNNN